MTRKRKTNTLVIVGVTVGAIAAMLASAIGLIFYLTQGQVKASDQFLARISEGRIHEAYQSTASVFRSGVSEEAFAEAINRSGLRGYASSSWHSRSRNNDQATLEGTITTRDGREIPLTMHLIKENDDWKIIGFEIRNAGITHSPSRQRPANRNR